LNKTELNTLIARTKPLRLLVVEDDAQMREATVTFLDTFFDHIYCANDGMEASKLREINCDLPIIVLSAYTESSYFLESIKYSVDGYLLKPFDVKQFFLLLLKVVKRLEEKQELLHLLKIFVLIIVTCIYPYDGV